MRKVRSGGSRALRLQPPLLLTRRWQTRRLSPSLTVSKVLPPLGANRRRSCCHRLSPRSSDYLRLCPGPTSTTVPGCIPGATVVSPRDTANSPHWGGPTT
jgi:hypothetical protein